MDFLTVHMKSLMDVLLAEVHIPKLSSAAVVENGFEENMSKQQRENAIVTAAIAIILLEKNNKPK